MSKRPVIAILCNFPAWLVNDKIPVRPGHYAVWLIALHEALKKDDTFDIHWVTLSKEIKKRVDFTAENQHFHVLPAARKTIGLHTAYVYDRWQIRKCLKGIKPDLVHGWGNEYCYGLAVKDFKGKSILSIQGAMQAYVQRADMGSFQTRQSKYEPQAVRAAKFITTESGWAADRIRELSPTAPIHHWDYAVEERFFGISRQMSPAPECILAGTSTPVKNVATAIAAFSRPELRHVKLYLAGIAPGEYQQLPENIIPLGRINRDEMAARLASSWCLIHPSLADTGPTIVKEARVVGLPVIVSSECGSKQYVEEGKSGFIIPPRDVDALVKAVLHVTSSRENAQAMGDYNRESCRKALSAETMVAGLISIYRSQL